MEYIKDTKWEWPTQLLTEQRYDSQHNPWNFSGSINGNSHSREKNMSVVWITTKTKGLID